MFNLEGKIIVVTGGVGLLGKEIVQFLRRQGALVYVADIVFEESSGFDLFMDITNEVSVREGIEGILSKEGKIDGWVNNAYPRTPDWRNKLEEVPFDSWRANVDMHLNGYFLCCQLALEQMKVQGYGSLVNMSSIYGIVGPDFSIYDNTNMTTPVAYSAIKGGLISLTRYLASYFGPFGVRVNCISPGGIFDEQAASFVEKYSSKVPLRRMGAATDIASAVCFLMSAEASYITGHNLVIDGGLSIV